MLVLATALERSARTVTYEAQNEPPIEHAGDGRVVRYRKQRR
jgi:hypothetical protein